VPAPDALLRGERNAPGQDGARALRPQAEQAFARAAGAPLVAGNAVRLLRDAREHLPAWEAAVEGARESVCVEAYILGDDAVGRRFADLLAARARAGVRVRLLWDWMGCLGEASGGFFRRLDAAGVETRCFNPPRLDAPLAWLGRNHRKSLVVDGGLASVTGLCLAERWLGVPARGIAPWRDTGVELRGPAAADVARAFAASWAEAGPPLPAAEIPSPGGAGGAAPPCGDVALRVVATEPATSGMYRLDQLVAAVARETLWITDAYFVGTAAYVQALRAAAADGVDVRLLVPGESDLALVKRLSLAGYRPLLEAGVRIFEWNGSMLHAKTAVADGRWARVGSSNLNVSSWLANWELDVAVEDEGFGQAMELAFEEDLARATEVVLGERRVRPRVPRAPSVRARLRGAAPRNVRREGAAVSAAGALRLGRAVGAAIRGTRVLGPAEANVLAIAAALLLALGAGALAFPRSAAVPVGVALAWLGVTLLVKAVRLRRRGAGDVTPGGPAPR
jgi:cardiolipin synthase